jgi:hypothetical protein
MLKVLLTVSDFGLKQSRKKFIANKRPKKEIKKWAKAVDAWPQSYKILINNNERLSMECFVASYATL